MSRNIQRRHLTPSERKDLIRKLLKLQPEKSNRQIAETVKADHKTVAVVRREEEATGEIPQLEKTVGKDGKERRKAKRVPRQSPPPQMESADEVAERERLAAQEKRHAEYGRLAGVLCQRLSLQDIHDLLDADVLSTPFEKAIKECLARQREIERTTDTAPISATLN
jgi:hypothetical protein